MFIEIYHPTNKPNFTVVSVGDLQLWFSYQTCVAFQEIGIDVFKKVIHNYWGSTTGRHLNLIDGGTDVARSERLEEDEFNRVLAARIDPYVTS